MDDVEIIADAAARNSTSIMARAGRLPLASYILTSEGVQMLVAGANDDVNRRMFAMVTRMFGAKHDAIATAVVVETLSIEPRNEDEVRRYHEIKESGGSFDELPCTERVLVIAGNGICQEVREYDIVRHHAEMVEMHLCERTRLEGAARVTGLLADMHALPDERCTEEFIQTQRELDQMGFLDGTPVKRSREQGRPH